MSVKTSKIGPKLSKRDGNTMTSIDNDNQILADSQSQTSELHIQRLVAAFRRLVRHFAGHAVPRLSSLFFLFFFKINLNVDY